MNENEKTIAAHNIASILTKMSIGKTEREQLSISIGEGTPNFKYLNETSQKYSFIYNEFCKCSFNHLKNVLSEIE